MDTSATALALLTQSGRAKNGFFKQSNVKLLLVPVMGMFIKEMCLYKVHYIVLELCGHHIQYPVTNETALTWK